MNNRAVIVIISVMLMLALMWLSGGLHSQHRSSDLGSVAAAAASPTSTQVDCPTQKPCEPCENKQPSPVAVAAPVVGGSVYSPSNTHFTPYELYVNPEDRPAATLTEADISGRTLWWALDAVHSMRQMTFNVDKTIKDETGWYGAANTLTTWSVEGNRLKLLKQSGSHVVLHRVNPIAPDVSDLILVQDVDPNFSTGTGKYMPEIARSAHPLCKSGWAHGTGKMCYRVTTRGVDLCKKLDPASTSQIETEADIKVIQNVLLRQRRFIAAAVDTNQKVTLDSDKFLSYAPSTDVDAAVVCSLPKVTDPKPPSDVDSKKQGYTHNLPLDAHELFPHAILNTREGVGDILEMEDFKTAIEIGVQSGAYSDKLLRAWKSADKYYLIDPWENQKNYVDTSNIVQEEQDKLWNFVKDRFSMYKDQVVLVRKYSNDAVSMFEDGSIDFIYVDARHDYGAVLEDITMFWPKCRKGGIMAGHDFIYAHEAALTGQKWQIQGDGSLHIGGPRMAAEHFANSVGRKLTITREMPTWNGVAFRSWLIRC